MTLLAFSLLGLLSGAGLDDRFGVVPASAPASHPAAFDGDFDGAPVVSWSVRLPGGRSGAGSHTERARPIIAGDAIFVGAAAGDALYELDRRDGRLRGSYPARGSVESAPVVADGRVFFADTGGTVWCYEIGGTKVWSYDTGAPILTAPVVADGRLFITNVSDTAVALDAVSGALQWRYRRKPDLTREAELALYARPAAVLAGTAVLFGFSDGAVAALDAARGEEIWSRRVGEGRYPDLVAPPAVSSDGVAFASGYFSPLVAIDMQTRAIRWRAEVGAAAQAVLDGGTLYHPGTDGKLRAFDPRTGEASWTWDSGGTGALTSPVLTPAGMLVGSSLGGLWLLDPSSGAIRWRFPDGVRLSGVASAPSVEGRQAVFVTDAGRVYSLVVPVAAAPPDDLWPRGR